MMVLSEMEKTYMQIHAASGLEAGDTVKVLRAAKDHEQGWDNSWAPQMDKLIGKTSKIRSDHGTIGFELDDGYIYPAFVLEKVPDP